MGKRSIFWVDVIRVIATFSVIWLHSAAPLLYKYNEISAENWWVGNVYDSMVRMCVPLFFLLSGYLLLDKRESVFYFLKKRMSKVVFPLLAWSVLYILWKHYYQGNESISFRSFYSLALIPAYYHLWFLYAIVGLYLFMPILRVLVQNSNKELLYYFVTLWFIAVSVIPFFEKITHLDSRIDLKMISGFVGYLVIGYLLGNMKAAKKYFILSITIFIISVVVTSIGTYYLTVKNNGVFVGDLYSYLSPNIIIMSVAFFVSFKYLAEKYEVFNIGLFKKSINILSSASLGIYLVHTMVLYVLRTGHLGFKLSPFSTSAIYSVPATAIVTFTLSFFIIIIIQRIPIVRRIVP